MARIRTIKPEFWSDEKLSECSLSARLTFIGLWSFADDEGRMEFQPARLRMQIYPCGSVTIAKLREFVGELTEHSLIRVYEADGKEILDIPGFTKHQRINRPTPSKLPEYSLNAHGVLTEHSPLEGKGTGKEGKGNGKVAGVAPPSKVVPIAEPPPGLDRAAWSRWLEYRRSIGKPLKPASHPIAMNSLTKHGVDQGAVVDQSIANGWQGLFELKSGSRQPLKEGNDGLPTLGS